MMDFELAERSPWRTKWPSHKVLGCLFHYTQCIWRYVSKYGGIPLMAIPTIKGIIYMAYALPLVEMTSLDEAINLMKAEATKLQDSTEHFGWLQSFFQYIADNWFHRFSPSEWNHFLSEIFEHITNNAAGITQFIFMF